MTAGIQTLITIKTKELKAKIAETSRMLKRYCALEHRAYRHLSRASQCLDQVDEAPRFRKISLLDRGLREIEQANDLIDDEPTFKGGRK